MFFDLYGSDRAILQRQHALHLIRALDLAGRGAGFLDRDLPRRSVRPGTVRAQFAADVDQIVLHAAAIEEARDLVGAEALRDRGQVEVDLAGLQRAALLVQCSSLPATILATLQ